MKINNITKYVSLYKSVFGLLLMFKDESIKNLYFIYFIAVTKKY